LTIGGMRGGLAMPELLRANRIPGPVAQGDHQRVPAGRSAAPRHVRHEARRAGRNPRRVLADQTNVPGIEFCELFPKLAKMADSRRGRSLSDSDGGHGAYQCMTGHRRSQQQPPGGWPSFGVVEQLQGNANPAVPRTSALMYRCGDFGWRNSAMAVSSVWATLRSSGRPGSDRETQSATA
jgi:hypothetical protein